MTGPRYTCPTCRRWQQRYDAAHEIALQNAELLKAAHDGNLELARELCALKRRNAELLREVARLTNENEALKAMLVEDAHAWHFTDDGWVQGIPADDDPEARRIRAIDALEVDAPAEWNILLEDKRPKALASLEVYRVEHNL